MQEHTDLNQSNRLNYHTAEDFIEAYKNTESLEEQGEVREKLKKLDSGRWHELLDTAHNHLAHADLDARDNLEGIHSERFLKWVGAFGLVEDLNTFADITGVER